MTSTGLELFLTLARGRYRNLKKKNPSELVMRLLGDVEVDDQLRSPTFSDLRTVFVWRQKKNRTGSEVVEVVETEQTHQLAPVKKKSLAQ